MPTPWRPDDVDLSTPDALLQQPLYHPVAVATGSRQVLLAGQVAVEPDGEVVADDLAGQVHAALRNVVLGVRAAGGGPLDVARLTVFVVGWTERMVGSLEDGIQRAQRTEGLADPLPPLTVIGVQALYRPALLVEIEAVAVLD